MVVAEIRVSGTGGENEVVVVEAGSAGQLDAARVRVDRDDFIHQHFSIALMAQDGANGLGDIGRG